MTAFRVHMNNQIPVVIDDVDDVDLQGGYVKLFGEKSEERSLPVLAIFSESQFAYLERVEILVEGAFRPDEWECDDAGCVCQDLADDEIIALLEGLEDRVRGLVSDATSIGEDFADFLVEFGTEDNPALPQSAECLAVIAAVAPTLSEFFSNTPGQQPTAPLGVGDHVVATRAGAYNGETGTITQVLDEGMVFIRWDNPEYGELCFSADGLQRTPS